MIQGTADEVIQMWQYVQRIDTDVRDVVLRLGKIPERVPKYTKQ